MIGLDSHLRIISLAKNQFSDPNPHPEHFEFPPNAACELFAPISHPDQSLLNSGWKRPKMTGGGGVVNGEWPEGYSRSMCVDKF